MSSAILPKSFCSGSWIGILSFHQSKRRRAVSPREDSVSCHSKAASVFLEQADQLEDERWKSAYAWFERAMELPAGERSAFSQQAIQDPEVLRLVLDLLESQQGPEETTQPERRAAAPSGRPLRAFRHRRIAGARRNGRGLLQRAIPN